MAGSFRFSPPTPLSALSLVSPLAPFASLEKPESRSAPAAKQNRDQSRNQSRDQSRDLWLALWLPELADDARDQALLESLAAWSHCLTPTVSLQPGEGLLLEVGRSLKFFSGLGPIKQLLVREIRRRGLEFGLSTASTPLAALWLARAKSVDVPSHADLPGFLRVLDLAVTGWPAPVQRRLREMGVTTIGEILRLPRAGFARRFGRECLEDLDRASGRLPDPKRTYQAPQNLCWAADFEAELIDRQILAAAIEAGIESLVCDLRARQAEISEIEIDLLHLHGPDTRECVQFVEPVHGQARLLAPLLVHLETIELMRPVTGLRLQTGVLLPMECAAARLLVDIEDGPAAGVSPFALIECLRGRLGLEAVCGIELLAEHRPERAWNRLSHGLMQVASNAVLPSHWAAERPLWLLPWPRSLNRAACVPEPISGPERIESGWWDGMDVRRDYYVMRTEDGERWWVFRDCETRQWYLHGFFG